MEEVRMPYQGLKNVLSFNRHYYIFSAIMLLMLLTVIIYSDGLLMWLALAMAIMMLFAISASIAATAFVYDFSCLYEMPWLPEDERVNSIINFTAGFDESSAILQMRFPGAKLLTADFYQVKDHSERSIRIARKLHPPFPGTIRVQTASLPFGSDSVDIIIAFLSAHEIRNRQERVRFFRECRRVLAPAGRIYITEHLRDPANFLAYSAGFFHFFSAASWRHVFSEAGLRIEREEKTTPFISTFILTENGAAV